MAIDYCAPLRLIRGLVPGVIDRGDGFVTTRQLARYLESSPCSPSTVRRRRRSRPSAASSRPSRPPAGRPFDDLYTRWSPGR